MNELSPPAETTGLYLAYDAPLIVTPGQTERAVPVCSEITAPSVTDLPEAFQQHRPTRSVATAIGAVTVIGEHDGQVDFTAHDLGDLLAQRKPFDYPRPEGCPPWKMLIVPPDNDQVIVRWHVGMISNSTPDTLQALVQHIDTFEREMLQVTQLGIPTLARTVYIVEKDPHHQNKAVSYMAVARHNTGEHLTAHTNNPAVQLQLSSAAAEYYLNKSPNAVHISDNLSRPEQYSADGVLFDYDPRLTSAPTMLSWQLTRVQAWLRRLPPSDRQTALLGRIDHALSRLPSRH